MGGNLLFDDWRVVWLNHQINHHGVFSVPLHNVWYNLWGGKCRKMSKANQYGPLDSLHRFFNSCTYRINALTPSWFFQRGNRLRRQNLTSKTSHSDVLSWFPHWKSKHLNGRRPMIYISVYHVYTMKRKNLAFMMISNGKNPFGFHSLCRVFRRSKLFFLLYCVVTNNKINIKVHTQQTWDVEAVLF